MGYFKGDTPTKRVQLTDTNYWVEIYTELRWGQSKQFFRASKDGEMDLVASADAYLLALIKSWNLDDEAGAVVPVTIETINSLSQDDALLILNSAGLKDAEAEAQKKD